MPKIKCKLGIKSQPLMLPNPSRDVVELDAQGCFEATDEQAASLAGIPGYGLVDASAEGNEKAKAKPETPAATPTTPAGTPDGSAAATGGEAAADDKPKAAEKAKAADKGKK